MNVTSLHPHTVPPHGAAVGLSPPCYRALLSALLPRTTPRPATSTAPSGKRVRCHCTKCWAPVTRSAVWWRQLTALESQQQSCARSGSPARPPRQSRAASVLAQTAAPRRPGRPAAAEARPPGRRPSPAPPHRLAPGRPARPRRGSRAGSPGGRHPAARLDTPAAAPPLHGRPRVQGRAVWLVCGVHGSLLIQHCEASARHKASAAAQPGAVAHPGTAGQGSFPAPEEAA